jgi:RNA polymerase sigma-70 factor (ECF subfamily)
MQALLVANARSYARPVQHLAALNDDDAELGRRIAAAAPGRDAAAEQELCRRFAPRIRLYGLRHLRSEAGAADLVQDVLLMTLQKLRAREVREPERLASFILGTCRQVVIDARRGGQRRDRLLETYAGDLFPLEDAQVEALDTGLTAALGDCLQRLPERERAVLMMTFYDDRPADAVGVELGLSAGNVRVIRHRGIERLRACMRIEEGVA